MAVLVNLSEERCNLSCQYCYLPWRKLHPQIGGSPFHIEEVKETLRKQGRDFSLFGGEPLLFPIEILEDLFAFGFKEFGINSIQTNGTLITQDHINLFLRYSVCVGVSIDGPEDMNQLRWAGSLKETRHSTSLTEENIRRVCDAGINIGVSVVLHRHNAAAEHLETMVSWLERLHSMGVQALRFHLLTSENPTLQRIFGLSDLQGAKFFEFIVSQSHRWKGMVVNPIHELRALLQGHDEQQSCLWSACDPKTTPAVRGVGTRGDLSLCARLASYRVAYVRGLRCNFERHLRLYETPFNEGGCAGCRFFLICKGGCPASSLDNDLTKRTRHCAIWQALLETLEKDLLAQHKTPLSLRIDQNDLVRKLIEGFRQGYPPSFALLGVSRGT